MGPGYRRQSAQEAGVGSGQLSTRRLADGTLMIELRGELDVASTMALRDRLSAAILAIRPPGVVVDLGLVTFMDSSTLGALTSTQRTARSVGAWLRVVNPSPFVERLLRITGVAEALGYQPAAG
jgi:anti-anti-sigma factor